MATFRKRGSKRQVLIRRKDAAIDPKNKTTTSSSSSNRGTNCVVGRTNPTFGTTTINCN